MKRIFCFLLLCFSLAAQAEIKIGQRLEWLDVQPVNGPKLSAAELQSKVVLVQFWATWCPFCATQNKNLQALHRASKSRMTILALSVDKDPSLIAPYVAHNRYEFAAAALTPELERRFAKRRGLPQVVLVKDSQVVFVASGEMFPEDLNELAEKFANLKP